jgi:hypothetical protein
MMDWLRKHFCREAPPNSRDSHETGQWAIWMYQSPGTNDGMPLLLFVYEWERAGYCALWVKRVFHDDDEEWDGGAPGWDVFDQPYLFSQLIVSGEARRVGPVPFDMPSLPGEGKRDPTRAPSTPDA